jgi:hypothetical protein
MRARGQFLVTLLVVVLVAGAGVYLQRQVGPKVLAAPVAGKAASGAWFCPHGGGPQGTKDWRAMLAVANPGSSPVRIRVTELDAEKPAAADASVVPPGRELLLDVPADAPEASTFVEYFGGWVSAGWVMRAQGSISGVAAESCTPEADRTWTLADGDTSLPQGAKPKEGNQTQLVIMNPFSTDAALSVVLYGERAGPTSTKDLTDFVLPAMRSVAIPLAKYVLGPEALGAQVRVSVGRVAAATLSTSFVNGIRSAEGVPGPPPQRIFLPAGTGHASTQLAITAPAPQGVTVSAALRGRQEPQLVADLDRQQQQGGTSAAHDTSIQGPSTYQITASGGVASAVRTLASDTSHDGASTSGSAVAAPAWVVPPAAASEPARPSIVLFDAGTQDARVTLTALPSTALPSGKGKAPNPVTVTVPAGRSSSAPDRFASAVVTSSVLVVSSGPPVVAASAAFSEGQHGVGGFAVAMGVVDPADGNNA